MCWYSGWRLGCCWQTLSSQCHGDAPWSRPYRHLLLTDIVTSQIVKCLCTCIKIITNTRCNKCWPDCTTAVHNSIAIHLVFTYSGASKSRATDSCQRLCMFHWCLMPGNVVKIWMMKGWNSGHGLLIANNSIQYYGIMKPQVFIQSWHYLYKYLTPWRHLDYAYSKGKVCRNVVGN